MRTTITSDIRNPAAAVEYIYEKVTEEKLHCQNRVEVEQYQLALVMDYLLSLEEKLERVKKILECS